jgi:hypothetical protein
MPSTAGCRKGAKYVRPMGGFDLLPARGNSLPRQGVGITAGAALTQPAASAASAGTCQSAPPLPAVADARCPTARASALSSDSSKSPSTRKRRSASGKTRIFRLPRSARNASRRSSGALSNAARISSTYAAILGRSASRSTSPGVRRGATSSARSRSSSATSGAICRALPRSAIRRSVTSSASSSGPAEPDPRHSARGLRRVARSSRARARVRGPIGPWGHQENGARRLAYFFWSHFPVSVTNQVPGGADFRISTA